MPDRPILEAVLFDAGGTLVRLDFEWMAATLVELGLDATAEKVRRAEVAGRRRYDAARGRPPAGGADQPAPLGASGDTVGYFAAMAEGVGGTPAQVALAVERFFARQAAQGLWTRPMEGARGAIDALAGLGLDLAVVSNSDGRAAMHLRDCGVLDGIGFVVDSHLVGAEKPDPAIFRVALDRLGIEPERALFVGDILSIDQVGAAAAGTRFVLIDPYHDYAPAGVAAIERIGDLPEWVRANFAIRSRASERSR